MKQKKQPLLWVMPSDKLLDALKRAHRGENVSDIMIDLWEERDPESNQLTLSKSGVSNE